MIASFVNPWYPPSVREEEVIHYFLEAHSFVRPFVIDSLKKEKLVPTLIQLHLASGTIMIANLDSTATDLDRNSEMVAFEFL
jgi:hypothetical protein